MKLKTKIIGAAIGALGMVGITTAAYAYSVTPADERVGLDVASPLPEGIYFLDIASLGGNNLGGVTTGNLGAATLNYDTPAIVWSTPWSFNGIRLEFLGALPFAETGWYHAGASSYSYGLYNPFIAASFNYSFGNGFSVAYLAGAYLPMTGDAGFRVGSVQLFNATTFHQMFALAYHMGGWNFTSNVQWGIVSNTSGSTALCQADGFAGSCQVLQGDYLNYDLALTKTIGKWEVGVVGYGSTDLTKTWANTNAVLCAANKANGGAVGCGESSQFALGGLVGYNFGPVITQMIISSDVYEHNYNMYDTRATMHFIVPLWNPPAPKVVTAKY